MNIRPLSSVPPACLAHLLQIRTLLEQNKQDGGSNCPAECLLEGNLSWPRNMCMRWFFWKPTITKMLLYPLFLKAANIGCVFQSLGTARTMLHHHVCCCLFYKYKSRLVLCLVPCAGASLRNEGKDSFFLCVYVGRGGFSTIWLEEQKKKKKIIFQC